MGMEIKKLLTEAKVSLYFGEDSFLVEDKHEDTYIQASLFCMNIVDELFSNEVKIIVQHQIDSELFSKVIIESKTFADMIQFSFLKQSYYTYLFNLAFFEENKKAILKTIYQSNNMEVVINSQKLYINIYADPITIGIYYGDDANSNFKSF